MGYGVFHGEAGLMPKDREWAWWLTMRDLAAVAGLALWVEAGGLARVAVACTYADLLLPRDILGWEAPDA